MEFFKGETKFPFMATRKVWYTLSAILMIGSVVSFATRGLNLGIDFTGGISATASFAQAANVDAVRTKLTDAGFKEPQVTTFGSSRDVTVRLPPDPGQSSKVIRDKIEGALKAVDPSVEVKQVEVVGPQVGNELRTSATWALFFTLLLIGIYIAFRFHTWRLSLGAILAVIHDPVLVLGIFSITQTSFVLTGVAAANHAGPALALAFIIAGFGCTLAGLCYAEFAAMIPVSGSAYSYSYATLGEGIAWFIGWNLVLEYLFAVATVSVGWSGYLVSLLDQIGMHLPTAFTSAPFAKGAGDLDIVRTGAIINVPAMAIVSALTVICYVGIRQSSGFNTVIVAIKVTVVLLFIAFGVGYINSANWHPFIPANEGPGKYGIPGLIKASGVIFFAYIGFDAISTAAQETRNPQRDMPIGILSSLVICTILYVVVALVLTGMVNYKELNVPAPVALAIDKYTALHWMGWPIKLGAIAGMTSVMLVMTLAQARIFLAMARDGLIWKSFAKVHPKFHTPSTGTIVTGVAAALIGGLFPVGILGEMVSIGTLAAFVTVCIGVLVLRRTRPDLERPFRTPYPWFTCIVGAVVCFVMMVGLGVGTWIRLVVWTIIGFIIYAMYGYKNSRLHRANGARSPASATR